LEAILGDALIKSGAFFACDDGKSALVGRWDLVVGSSRDNPEDMELLSDGTGIVDTKGITYKTESGRFYLAHPKKAESYKYEVSGSMLTLTKDDGTILRYIDFKRKKPPSFTNFTDSRNSNTYKTAKMSDGKVWFAENLNYAAEGSKCYDNKEENCQKYGRLYDWAMAVKACPKGWHLPSEEEWKGLGIVNGKHLKAKDWKGMNSFGFEAHWEGTDAFGFAALPSGNGFPDGRFDNVGEVSGWWGSSEDDSDGAYNIIVYRNETSGAYPDKCYFFSVRCIQGDSHDVPITSNQTESCKEKEQKYKVETPKSRNTNGEKKSMKPRKKSRGSL
jgi:uncharacterized protein (TIGR02145 family)